jgi:hypothetical protein
MKLRTGDKVRFLNDPLEGTVTELLSNGRVEVIDGDGFKHITVDKNLVRIDFVPGEIDLSQNYEDEPQQSKKSVNTTVSQPVTSYLEQDNTVYGAIRLIVPKQPMTTDVELLIINNTSYLLAYSVSRRVNDIRTGVDLGILKARTENSLGIFSQDEIYRFNGFEVQLLFHGIHEFKPRPPATKVWTFSSGDFVNPDFKRTFAEKDEIMLMPLYTFSESVDVDLKTLLEKYKESEKEEQKRMVPKGKRQEFTILKRTKVVDLHIEELVKEHSEMSNSQIISYQLNYFMYELDQAFLHKLNKIVFIHGVGQGVLKSAIREELKRVPNIRYGDAPSEQFGYGATEVEFI